MSFLLSILVAATGSIASAPPVDPVAWVEALKVPSTVPEIPGLYQSGPGAPDPEHEARILEPFESLTTEQAQIAVPLLLDLLEDQTPVFHARMSEPYRTRNRAWEALFRISFRRIGHFFVRIGCYGPPPAIRAAQQQREVETVANLRRWWTENRELEISDWRQRAVDEKLAAFHDRSGDEAVTAIEDLAILGRLCMHYLDREAVPEIAKAADDPSADSRLREYCIRALIEWEAEGAIDSAERFARETRHGPRAREAVLRDLEGAGDRGIPALISLARYFAEGSRWPQRVEDSNLFWDAVFAVQHAAHREEPWMTTTPDTFECRMEVVQAMERWWAKSGPHPRPWN